MYTNIYIIYQDVLFIPNAVGNIEALAHQC